MWNVFPYSLTWLKGSMLLVITSSACWTWHCWDSGYIHLGKHIHDFLLLLNELFDFAPIRFFSWRKGLIVQIVSVESSHWKLFALEKISHGVELCCYNRVCFYETIYLMEVEALLIPVRDSFSIYLLSYLLKELICLR